MAGSAERRPTREILWDALVERDSVEPRYRVQVPMNDTPVYARGVGKPSALGPAFSFKASVNSCKLETICGALANTVEANFSA